MTQLPELSVKILELVREHGRITIGDAIVITGVSRNTLKSHFQKLVRDSHLEKHGIGKKYKQRVVKLHSICVEVSLLSFFW